MKERQITGRKICITLFIMFIGTGFFSCEKEHISDITDLSRKNKSKAQQTSTEEAA